MAFDEDSKGQPAASAPPAARAYFDRRDACPACDSTAFRTIYESSYAEPRLRAHLEAFYAEDGGLELEYLEGASYLLCLCQDCGLYFQREIPNDDLMVRLYEKWIDPQKGFERHLRQDDLVYHARHAQEIMQVIQHFGRVPSTLRFLDFGMGWGKWALMAKAFGCESYGMELSQERIAYARSNGIQVIDWDEIPGRAFDFINTEQVFEHIPEPRLTLQHLATALAPDGLLKISVPTADDIERRLQVMDWTAPKGSRNSLNPIAPLEHINLFDRSSLDRMAAEAGLEPGPLSLRAQYRYTTNWGGPARSLKNLLLPLYRNLLRRRNYVFYRRKN